LPLLVSNVTFADEFSILLLMKYQLLPLAACLTAALSVSAWNVSTEVSPQKALIEEYTGIHCPNCPDGHRVASELMNLHPGDVYSVAIHAGYFAIPAHDEPNFVTPLGTALNDYFQVGSYPAGVVNRRAHEDNLVIGRGSWGAACRAVNASESSVNLWAQSTYEAATRTMTLDVEAYFTSDMAEPRLNVFMVQNEILGPQSGGQLGVEYPHRHMLRARLTDNDFGDAVAQKNKGEYFSRSFTYLLPEAIDAVPTDPVNMEFLIFVTEGAEDVRQVCLSRPATPGLEPRFGVSTTGAPIAIGKNYALNYVEVYINNHGGVDITSATFDITLNGKTVSTEWTGLVPPHTSKLVKVNVDSSWKEALDTESNKYAIRMMKANGIDVETSSIRGSFNSIFTYPGEMTAVVKTDLNGADNTWRIIDEDGNTVYEFGPYPEGETGEYSVPVLLEDGKVYGIEISDCWGDGVHHPLGFFKLYNQSGKLVAQIKEINGYGLRQFFRVDASLGVGMLSAVSPVVSERYFDVSGVEVLNPSTGLYIKRTVYADGSLTVEKKIIK